MTTPLTRAKQLIEARMADRETADRIEQAIALELLGPDTVARDKDVRPLTYPQHAYLSPMAATEAVAYELQRGLANLASNIGAQAPAAGKYNPLFASPTLFKETWRARQVMDECGVPYWFYVEYAVLRWYEQGHKRMPRLSQLTTPDMAMHVMQLWADPGFRWNYPLFADWDARFDVDNYCGDVVQDRALALIDQRLMDATAMGHNPAAALANYLDVNITEAEAERRYGADLVLNAFELAAVAIAEHAALSAMEPEAAIVKILQEA